MIGQIHDLPACHYGMGEVISQRNTGLALLAGMEMKINIVNLHGVS